MTMEKKITFIIFCLISFGTYAQSTTYDAVEAVKAINHEVKEVGKIDPPCLNCQQVAADKTYHLDKKEMTIDDPLFYSKKGYVINLIRNKNSPNVVSLKFKVGHRVCAKMTTYVNPYSNSLGIDCLFYTTQMEDQEIDLNLKDLPKASDENEIYEITFSREEYDSGKYKIELNSLKGPSVKVEKDNKFFGRGINLKIKKDESK